MPTLTAEDRPHEAEIEPATRKGLHWIALLPSVLVLVFRSLRPEFLDNECGKLVEARRILEPAFLSRDWLQSNCSENTLFRLFSYCAAPLFAVIKDPIVVAMVGRALIWALLLYCLFRLSRTLGIEGYALAIGLPLWIARSQSQCADEWIFGGIEGKCVAYALLFLAIVFVLRRKEIAAAICCGFAIWFHILVGTWGSMALGGAMLLCYREYGWRKPLKFGAITLAFLAPLAAAYLHRTSDLSYPESVAAANRLIIFYANPMHLNPEFFGGYAQFGKMCVRLAFALFVFWRMTSRRVATLMTSFLGILALEFAAGLIASAAGWYPFVKIYPFRVADTLIPLFFWLTLPMFVYWLLTREVVLRRPNYAQALLWCVVLGGAAGVLVVKSGPATLQALHRFDRTWSMRIHHQYTPWRQTTEWIRLHTPESAVIIAPPWRNDFWLEAQRAEVVNERRAPHDRSIVEWHARLVALNGSFPRPTSWAAENEIQRNSELYYSQFNAAAVEELGRKYDADYFIALRPLSPSAGTLVYQNSEYSLYQLKR
jgi:hypothetical protein